MLTCYLRYKNNLDEFIDDTLVFSLKVVRVLTSIGLSCRLTPLFRAVSPALRINQNNANGGPAK